MTRSLILPLATLALVSLVLSGCGRKGDLDVPGAAPVSNNNNSAAAKKKEVVEERPFFLDPLL